MSYEYELAMGTNKNAAAEAVTDETGRRSLTTQWTDAASDVAVPALAIGGVAALVLTFLALSVALPFGIGAVGGAITGPKGHKKEAAKKAAIYGGLAGIGSGIVLGVVSSVLESARPGAGRYVGGSGLIPFAVGLYIGYKQREKYL